MQRLSLWHLFIWLTITAAVSSYQLRGQLSWHKVLFVCCDAIALTVSAAVLLTWARGSRREPGHCVALAVSWNWLGRVILLQLFPYDVDDPQWIPDLYFAITFLESSLVYFFAAALFPWESRWRVASIVLGSDALAWVARRLFTVSTFEVADEAHIVIGLAAFVTTCTAVLIDIRLKKQRDWMHWAGLLATAPNWIELFGWQFFPALNAFSKAIVASAST